MKKLFFICLTLLILTGCGSTGPMGPSGPKGSPGLPGPGKKTTHTVTFDYFAINSASGFIEVNCPEVTQYSAVNVYALFSGNGPTETALPQTIIEPDKSITTFSFQVLPDKLRVRYYWNNTKGDIPAVAIVTGIIITIIN